MSQNQSSKQLPRKVVTDLGYFLLLLVLLIFTNAELILTSENSELISKKQLYYEIIPNNSGIMLYYCQHDKINEIIPTLLN